MEFEYIFNPFTGKFDIVQTGSTSSSGSLDFNQILTDQFGDVLVDDDGNVLTE
jgi:hypothetical protein